MKLPLKFGLLAERVSVVEDEYEDRRRIGNPHRNYDSIAIRGLVTELSRLTALCQELANKVEHLEEQIRKK